MQVVDSVSFSIEMNEIFALIVDEPTSALDVLVQQDIVNMLTSFGIE